LPQTEQTITFWIFFWPGMTSPTGTLLNSNPPHKRQRFLFTPVLVAFFPQYGHFVVFRGRNARHFGQTFWRSPDILIATLMEKVPSRKAVLANN